MKPNKTDKVSNSTMDALYNRASYVIEQARETAYRQVNEALVKRNWDLGKLIAEEELNGQDRATYGLNVIKNLSQRLSAQFGKGFTRRDLYHYLTFFKTYFDLFISTGSKVYSASTQSNIFLSWTHYRTLLQELNADARNWYEREAAEQGWSVRTWLGHTPRP